MHDLVTKDSLDIYGNRTLVCHPTSGATQATYVRETHMILSRDTYIARNFIYLSQVLPFLA